MLAAILAVLMPLCSAPAATQERGAPAPTITLSLPALRTAIAAAMARDSIPALAVAVVRDGAILCEKGFGFSDTARTVATTVHTPFYLASVTKTVMATAVMALAERGRLNIDRPANEYLPRDRRLRSEGPWSASSASVRHLLTHTSGVFDPQARRPSTA